VYYDNIFFVYYDNIFLGESPDFRLSVFNVLGPLLVVHTCWSTWCCCW